MIQSRFDLYELFHKAVHASFITDVEAHGSSLVLPVLADESVQSVLPTTNSDDFASLFDEPIAKGCTNARRGTYHEDGLVLKRHLAGSEGFP